MTDQATRTKVISRMLADDPEMSDREISRIVGCHHSIVNRARKRLDTERDRTATPPATGDTVAGLSLAASERLSALERRLASFDARISVLEDESAALSSSTHIERLVEYAHRVTQTRAAVAQFDGRLWTVEEKLKELRADG